MPDEPVHEDDPVDRTSQEEWHVLVGGLENGRGLLEVAILGEDQVGLRRGDHPDSVIETSREEFKAFIDAMKAGELDDLTDPPDPVIVDPHTVLVARAIESSIGQIEFLLAHLDFIASQNANLRRQLRVAEAEIAQLVIVKDALLGELRKRTGPGPQTAGLLAKVAVVLLSVIGGAAGGAAQEVTARALDDPESEIESHSVDIDVESVIIACNRVVALTDEPNHAG